MTEPASHPERADSVSGVPAALTAATVAVFKKSFFKDGLIVTDPNGNVLARTVQRPGSGGLFFTRGPLDLLADDERVLVRILPVQQAFVGLHYEMSDAAGVPLGIVQIHYGGPLNHALNVSFPDGSQMQFSTIFRSQSDCTYRDRLAARIARPDAFSLLRHVSFDPDARPWLRRIILGAVIAALDYELVDAAREARNS
ncbi:hypothetical protein [Brachybacterium timonense]|uniref:hypothetical protein n=1 Tax=Brachybacterium timonense TaxID=2050896 RepID=UPI000D0BC831|nr:hypothetical protein [Brachybacterium timonense]